MHGVFKFLIVLLGQENSFSLFCFHKYPLKEREGAKTVVKLMSADEFLFFFNYNVFPRFNKVGKVFILELSLVNWKVKMQQL